MTEQEIIFLLFVLNLVVWLWARKWITMFAIGWVSHCLFLTF